VSSHRDDLSFWRGFYLRWFRHVGDHDIYDLLEKKYALKEYRRVEGGGKKRGGGRGEEVNRGTGEEGGKRGRGRRGRGKRGRGKRKEAEGRMERGRRKREEERGRRKREGGKQRLKCHQVHRPIERERRIEKEAWRRDKEAYFYLGLLFPFS
jgi:hypothetical protein